MEGPVERITPRAECTKQDLQSTKLSISEHLWNKRWILPITNACNKTCGGCNELCGHFPKDKIWFLPLEDIEKYILLVKNYKKELTIIGGEPTIHPQWEQILDLLYKHSDLEFRVNTNGRLGHQNWERPHRGKWNVLYMMDPHPPEQLFFPGLVAAQDFLNLPNREDYWRKAQRECPIWAMEAVSIYRDKAYFCENAAAFDWLFHDGANGWKIEEGKSPFERTAEEVAEQANKFCYRCGWCAYREIDRKKQLVGEPSLITETNYNDFPKMRNGELLQLVIPEKLKKKARCSIPMV